MARKTFIYNAEIINENVRFKGSVLIKNGVISAVFNREVDEDLYAGADFIDATGLLLLPGVIDDQVHFRDPGLTYKGDLITESRAAVAGGVTSFMEMPNTKPQAVTIDLLEEKYKMASEKSMANYSFYMGATNDNLDELKKVDPKTVCGIKVFMGSSTGNMLVDKRETLEKIFSEIPMLIATHCEDESTIKNNIENARSTFGDDVPMVQHPIIRSEEACYKSTSFAVELARKYGTRLHILHLSTAKELSLFSKSIPLKKKRITAEVCIHHLLFDDSDYKAKGGWIKWNPSIKRESDKLALLQALQDDTIDVIATDHAPHTADEKKGGALVAMSGGPMVQHSLVAMLEFVAQKKLTYEKVVQKMCHAPAILFNILNRGFIRNGFAADLVLVDPNKPQKVTNKSVYYKCGWTPLDGMTLSHSVSKTFVNGNLVYNNGRFHDSHKGQRLKFNGI